MAESNPGIDYVIPENPSVIVDAVSMVYTVKDVEKPAKTGLPLNRIRYQKNSARVKALDTISLVVLQGESVGVIGRNGSGKSTLMRIVGGQLTPTTGRVLATGRPMLIGVNSALIPSLSGMQNIVLGCLAMGMTRGEVDAKIPSIVMQSGLGDEIAYPMNTYSSGMESRLRFAISTAIEPDVLIVDEALNTGDAQFTVRSKARMDELRARAGTVFIVSHSLDAIRSMCQRSIWIDQGELLMDGDSQYVTSMYAQYMNHLANGREGRALDLKEVARSERVLTEIVPRDSGRRKL